MQLIEVDVIRPEPLQTCLDCLPDLRRTLPRGRAVLAQSIGGSATRDLGGDKDHSRNAVVHRGRVDKDVDLLQKPITQAQLSTRIREVLDRR